MDPLESVEGAADPLAAKPAAATNPTTLRWVGYGLAGGAFLLGLADMVRPSLLMTEILLVAPGVILALALSSPASFEVSYRGRAHINVVLGMPILFLFMVNTFHAQLDPTQPLIPAAVGAVIGLAAGAYAATTRGVAGPMTMIGFFTACGAAYVYGAVAVTDIQFDASPGVAYQAPVLEQHRTYGRHTSYYVQLAPWGPKTVPNEQEVSARAYDQLPVGQVACVTLHPGLFHLPWYAIEPCDQAAPGA